MLLWFAEPFALIFWLVGSSALIILGHAAFIEPPVSSEYAGVEVRPVTSDTSLCRASHVVGPCIDPPICRAYVVLRM